MGRLDDAVETSKATFEAARRPICAAIDAMIGTRSGLVSRPDEIAVQFAIKIGAKAGAFISSASAEAHVPVSLKSEALT